MNMNSTKQIRPWIVNQKESTLRIEKKFPFRTPEESEYFTECVGASILFPNLRVFVEPLYGEPRASVAVECSESLSSIFSAEQIIQSIDEMYQDNTTQRSVA